MKRRILFACSRDVQGITFNWLRLKSLHDRIDVPDVTHLSCIAGWDLKCQHHSIYRVQYDYSTFGKIWVGVSTLVDVITLFYKVMPQHSVYIAPSSGFKWDDSVTYTVITILKSNDS